MFNSSPNAYFIPSEGATWGKQGETLSSLSSSTRTQIYAESETDHTPTANISENEGWGSPIVINDNLS